MKVIVSHPEILGGTACFRGTRVPLQNLVDYLEGGENIEEFLHQFPTVQRAQATQAIDEMRDALVRETKVPA